MFGDFQGQRRLSRGCGTDNGDESGLGLAFV
jgi:hypothetical protein